MYLTSVLHSHVSAGNAGKWYRVTAMMRKMTKGQMSRVRDHNYKKIYTFMSISNENQLHYIQIQFHQWRILFLIRVSTKVKWSLCFSVTHRLSDDRQSILPEKKPQLSEEGHQGRRLELKKKTSVH